MQSQAELEERLRCALEADASRAVGRYPDGPRVVIDPRLRPARRARRPTLALRVGLPLAGALALLAALLVARWQSPRTAFAATPPMLSFSNRGAPPIGPLLTRLAAGAAASPALEPPGRGFTYLTQESWYLDVAVGRSVSAKVVPTVTHTWTTTAGPQLAVTAAAPAVAAGALGPRQERMTRNGVTAGRPEVEHLSSRDVGPFASLSGLPSRPRALFSQLAAPSHVGWPDTPTDPVAVGHAMNSLVQYLNYSAADPAFLSHLYRMLLLVPGVSDAGWVTDRAGRRGLAVAVPTGSRGYRHSFRLIVRPGDGQLLDVEDIQLDQSALPAKPPFVYSYVVYLGSAHVQRLGDRP